VRYKILLLSDDIRKHTGVSNISKQIILNTCDEIDWIQISCGANKNINEIIDVSESIQKLTGKTGSVKLYPTSHYGNSVILREVLRKENPTAILHITDPHRWMWMYEMEHELRLSIPILYYHVWDNTPYPYFLKDIYKSCDWIGCASKLTYECVKNVVNEHKAVEYIPHGVDTNIFKKLDMNVSEKHRNGFLGKNYKFVVLVNNANIKRKELPSVIESFDKFCKKLSDTEQTDTVLLLHTNPENKLGTNLNTLVDDCYSHLNIKFSVESVNETWLNYIYNLASVTINIASNEGFGITTLESLATCTPIIINKTGGLQDQYLDSCGIAIQPKVRNLVGSQKTPYLYSDICSTDEVADALYTIFKNKENYIDSNKYESFIAGNMFRSEQMCVSIKRSIIQTIQSFTKRARYKIGQVK